MVHLNIARNKVLLHVKNEWDGWEKKSVEHKYGKHSAGQLVTSSAAT